MKRNRGFWLLALTGSMAWTLGACSSGSEGPAKQEPGVNVPGEDDDEEEAGDESTENSSSEDSKNESWGEEDGDAGEDDDNEKGEGDKTDNGDKDDDDDEGSGTGSSSSSEGSSSEEEDDDDEEDGDPTTFKDKALEACVKAALKSDKPGQRAKKIGDLKYLECRNMGIESLAGIQQCSGLTGLSLFENKIESIKPLSALKKLEFVQLGNNRIASIKALAKLSSLKKVGLAVNDIASVEPLAKLQDLEWVNLDVNKVSDLGALSKLEKLSWVTVDFNEITDKSSVKALETKGVLVYSDNQRGTIATRHAQASLLGEPAPTRELDPGTLRLVKDQRGAAELMYDTPQGSFPAIAEWHGELAEENGQVFLHQGRERRAIGTHDEDGLALCEGEYAEQCTLLVGVKNDGLIQLAPGEIAEPVVSVNIQTHDRWANHEGRVMVSNPDGSMDKEVMPFIFASPNQYDAGTCANMSTVGVMEVLLNQRDAVKKLDYAGDNNLSEPYFIVVQNKVKGVPYYFTDLPFFFNNAGGGLPDRLMPFKVNAKGSAKGNWSAKLPGDWKSKLVKTPKVERTVLFYDPPRNSLSKWNVGLMGEDVVERIKFELRTKNAPVFVVYNHYKYWHVSVVVGYDDNEKHAECPMVNKTLKFYEKDKDQSKSGPYAKKIRAHMKKKGGCSTKGYFYVRDSIYKGTKNEPLYNYGGGKSNGRYSARIVKREYEWVWYLSNHATAVYRGRQ